MFSLYFGSPSSALSALPFTIGLLSPRNSYCESRCKVCKTLPLTSDTSYVVVRFASIKFLLLHLMSSSCFIFFLKKFYLTRTWRPRRGISRHPLPSQGRSQALPPPSNLLSSS